MNGRGHGAPSELATPAPTRGRDGTADRDANTGEAALVRSVQRRVAEQVAAADRIHETMTGTPISDHERRSLVEQHLEAVMSAHAKDSLRSGVALLTPTQESRIRRAVTNELLGAGGLQPLLDDEHAEDILVIGRNVFVRDVDGTTRQVAPVAESDDELRELVRRLAAHAGATERRFDRGSPFLDLRLPDGSRLHASTDDVSQHVSVAIRRHRLLIVTLDDLVARGMLDDNLSLLLRAAVRADLTMMISGAVGAGKTTLLRAVAREIPPTQRLITIEDTYELGLDKDTTAHPQVVAYQARTDNVEGAGRIDQDRIFREVLRHSPDHIIVGEVRGDEVVTMLNATSAGNNGSLSTIHARTSAGVFDKIALYAAQSPQRLDHATTNRLIAEGLDLIVHLDRTADGTRVVTSIREVVGADGIHVVSNEIMRPGPDKRALPGAPPSHQLLDLLHRHGYDGWTRP